MVGDVKAHVVAATVVVSCRYSLPVLKLDKFFPVLMLYQEEACTVQNDKPL